MWKYALAFAAGFAVGYVATTYATKTKVEAEIDRRINEEMAELRQDVTDTLSRISKPTREEYVLEHEREKELHAYLAAYTPQSAEELDAMSEIGDILERHHLVDEEEHVGPPPQTHFWAVQEESFGEDTTVVYLVYDVPDDIFYEADGSAFPAETEMHEYIRYRIDPERTNVDPQVEQLRDTDSMIDYEIEILLNGIEDGDES